MRSNYGWIAPVLFLLAAGGVVCFFLWGSPARYTDNAAKQVADVSTHGDMQRPALGQATPETLGGTVAEPVTRVSVEVSDNATGSPLRDFELAVAPAPEEQVNLARLMPELEWHTVAASHGCYEIAGVPSETPLIAVARATDFAPGYVDVPPLLTGSAGEAHISLIRGGCIDGVVTDDTAKRLAGALVCLSEAEEAPLAMTDALGQFRVTTLSSNDRLIVVRHPECLPACVSVLTEPGKLQRLQIALDRGGTVEGTVCLGNEVEEGLQVTVSPLRPGHAQSAPQTGVMQGTTDHNGHFTVQRVPPGEMAVHVVSSAPAREFIDRWTRQQALVANGQVTCVNFTMPASTSEIEGWVTLDGRPPKEGAITLDVELSYDQESRIESFDADGHYRIESLPAGTAVLQTVIDIDGVECRKTATFDLAEGETVRQDFVFAQPGSVRGRVTGILPVEKAILIAFPGEPAQFPIHTLEDIDAFRRYYAGIVELPPDGAYRIEGLAPGPYAIIAAAGRPSEFMSGVPLPVRTAVRSVTIEANTELEVSIAFD